MTAVLTDLREALPFVVCDVLVRTEAAELMQLKSDVDIEHLCKLFK